LNALRSIHLMLVLLVPLSGTLHDGHRSPPASGLSAHAPHMTCPLRQPKICAGGRISSKQTEHSKSFSRPKVCRFGWEPPPAVGARPGKKKMLKCGCCVCSCCYCIAFGAVFVVVSAAAVIDPAVVVTAIGFSWVKWVRILRKVLNILQTVAVSRRFSRPIRRCYIRFFPFCSLLHPLMHV
jgi:hypothetical protein